MMIFLDRVAARIICHNPCKALSTELDTRQKFKKSLQRFLCTDTNNYWYINILIYILYYIIYSIIYKYNINIFIPVDW